MFLAKMEALRRACENDELDADNSDDPFEYDDDEQDADGDTIAALRAIPEWNSVSHMFPRVDPLELSDQLFPRRLYPID